MAVPAFLAVLLAAPCALSGELSCSVTYLSAEHVYLDTGSAGGLEVGQRGRVVRDGRELGEVEIVFVAERSASCRAIGDGSVFRVGDTVLFEVAVTPEPDGTAGTPPPSGRRHPVANAAPGGGGGPRGSAVRLRGSVALQWDHAEETGDRGLTTDVVRVPFRVQASGLGHGFDFRARGSLRHVGRDGFGGGTPGSEWRNRIREIALVRDGREMTWHVAIGRVGLRETSAAGPFDGLSLGRRMGPHLRIGLFGGFAPEWGDLGFGTNDHLFGADVHFNRRGRGGRRLDVVLAGIGRYRDGEISREYVTMTTTWAGTGGLSLLQAAEVDINRGWRRDGGAGAVVLSSFALTGTYRFHPAFSADLGYDDRDPVRTWESRSLPDSLFEDAGRKGWRAGLRWRPARRMYLFLGGTLRRDDRDGERISSWQVRVHGPDLLGDRWTVFAAARGFDGPWLSGLAPTAGLSRTFAWDGRLRLEGGLYDYTGNLDGSRRHNRWISAAGEKDLAAGFSVAVEYRQDWGDDIEGRRYFVELRRRF